MITPRLETWIRALRQFSTAELLFLKDFLSELLEEREKKEEKAKSANFALESLETPVVNVPTLLVSKSAELSQDDPFVDKRRSPRFKVDLPGSGLLLKETATVKENKRFSIQILDISKEGVRFQTRRHVELGDIAILNFRLLNSGLKKIHIEILWKKDLPEEDQRLFRYEFGGRVVEERKVQLLMIDYDRSLKIRELRGKKVFRVLTMVKQDMRLKLAESLVRWGFLVDEAANQQDMLPKLLSNAFSVVILDERIIVGGLPDYVRSLRKYRSEIMIVALLKGPRYHVDGFKPGDVNGTARCEIPPDDLSQLLDRMINNSLTNNWQLITQTKLKVIFFSRDKQVVAKLQDQLSRIKYFVYIEHVDGAFPRYDSINVINTFDFLVVDLQEAKKEHLDRIQRTLDELTIPLVGVTTLENKQAFYQDQRLDEIINLPVRSDHLEAVFMSAFNEKKRKTEATAALSFNTT